MTAMIAIPLALLIGLVLGRGIRPLLLVGLVWYAALAWQTAYIAHVGRNAFGGKSGLATVHWWAYWALQPVLLLVCALLVWVGSVLRGKIRERASRHRTAVRNRTAAHPG
jgi:hypothetical protein